MEAVVSLLTVLTTFPLNFHILFTSLTTLHRYIVSTESGNVLIWSVGARAVVFKTEHKNVVQLMLIDGHTKFMAVSRVSD